MILVWQSKTLVLLPLGAGGKGRYWLKRNLFRLLRRPLGAPVHGDHIWVRDILRFALKGREEILTGYFAELPYLWFNSPFELSQRARSFEKIRQGDQGNGRNVATFGQVQTLMIHLLYNE